MKDQLRFTTDVENRSALKAPRPIDIVQLQTTVSTVATARTDADFQIESLVANNTSGTADYVTVHLVPSGGSASTANTIAYQVVVAGNGMTVIFDREKQGLLQPGATVQALCGVNDRVNIWGYGFDYQGVYS
ncbi:hypothetical protein [uncultured Ruegeria sp.]|uniref:hypothetical protein n=1 Tax=uncultured Ruegeria sp. TaxID=259304 RepID=UPI0026267A67|nr:hypothetical protein [uncultured Ruegeria sp.]